MNQHQLILRTLLYYWRTNLAVLLGVAIGAAVIAGALIVGDSVRYSLRQMTLDRLGNVDYALSGSRFVRENLASEMRADFQKEEDLEIAPAIILAVSLQHERQESDEESSGEGVSSEPLITTAGQVNLIAADERLWSMLDNESLDLASDDMILNRRVADQLGVAVDDEVMLFIKVPQTIPQESLLGERDVDELVISVPMTVRQIVEPATTMGRFSLQPNQQLPLNAFVNLDRIQQELDLDELTATPRNPEARPARVNAFLYSTGVEIETVTAMRANEFSQRATDHLSKNLSLEDLHARLRDVPDKNYFSLESERMILEQPLSRQALETAETLGMNSSPVLVYLANEIASVDDPERFSMYSIAAGIPFGTEAPFGPLLDQEGKPVTGLQGNEVAINSWLAEDLQVEVGDEISIKYHQVGSRGDLPEETKVFQVAAILPLDGSRADDRGFTPLVKGITDAETFYDWDQPFPMKTERITERDDDYWEEYRATPKLFVSLETARKLWRSRFGNSTSVRIAPREDQNLEQAKEEFTRKFLETLSPQSLGLVVLPVKQQGLAAARGTQDFTGLFIGFSFFVIVAAAVLISLLFRLGVENRVQQTGLFSAIGMSSRTIRRLLLTEGVAVAIAGILLGSLLGIGYAELMIYGLTTWWRGAIGTSFLEVSVTISSLIIGGVTAFFVAIPGMWIGVRQLLKVNTKERLHGVLASESESIGATEGGGWKLWSGVAFVAISILSVLGVLIDAIPQSEAFGGFNWQIVAFFTGGFLSLVGLLLLYVVWLRKPQLHQLKGQGLSAAIRLGTRNPSRHRQRSSITVVLVAFATFVVVAVAAGRQKPSQMEPELYSGNGGFSIVAESAQPLLYDLSTEEGQKKLGLIRREDETLRQMLDEARIFAMRVRPGEDASCLNLYQTRMPKILGVSREFIDRGGFLFADTPGDNPWTLLEGRTKKGNVPVIGDMNTLQYSLHKPIGSTIEFPEELGLEPEMEVVGSLAGSVLQGVLIMSEENFLELFPSIEGYNYFLIETPRKQTEELTERLETGLVRFGFDAQPVGKRLENFLAVQNTYLSTFQALGGLGLLLGTIGLGTVMLRNVLERRSELALMRAIGFSRKMVGLMVLAENCLLLVIGLVIGTITALWAMLPNVIGRGADVAWWSGLLLLLAVLLTGTLAALAAIIEAVRTPILQTLREE